jgi:2-keto-4-pentenoate hydratase
VVAEGEPLNALIITAINVGARHGVMGEATPVQQTPEFLDALGEMTVRLTDASGAELSSAPGTPCSAIL